jgi:predicted DNA-binding transcriptional regulator AlpA
MTTGPVLLKVPEAAEILRMSPAAVYEQIRRFEASGGRTGLPALRVGRSLRVPLDAIEAWVARCVAAVGGGTGLGA